MTMKINLKDVDTVDEIQLRKLSPEWAIAHLWLKEGHTGTYLAKGDANTFTASWTGEDGQHRCLNFASGAGGGAALAGAEGEEVRSRDVGAGRGRRREPDVQANRP